MVSQKRITKFWRLTHVQRSGFVLISVFLFTSILLSTGCDWSARWDLRKAEKAIKQCDKVNAEFWAEPEYRKAQKALDLAMDLAHERKINEARDSALEAYEWALEATDLSIRRREEMEKEHDGLNRKDY
ncbi:hypothetical protein K9N50_10150 [bacterium]|nr:hypothetical protein [bacterium]